MLDTEEERTNLEGIYEEYKVDMLKYALYITKNREMAEDAVHNAFLSIIKHKNRLFLLSRKELRTQVVIFTKNKCIDLMRKQGYYSDEPIEDMENMIETDINPVEKRVVLIDEYRTVRKHIASLDEPSKLVLEMKYILGMTLKEIGEEMGLTAKHIDTKIMRAKAKVRKLMETGGVPCER
jgi:RNA polymerase sigma-70 factor (ECF subfamily)